MPPLDLGFVKLEMLYPMRTTITTYRREAWLGSPHRLLFRWRERKVTRRREDLSWMPWRGIRARSGGRLRGLARSHALVKGTRSASMSRGCTCVGGLYASGIPGADDAPREISSLSRNCVCTLRAHKFPPSPPALSPPLPNATRRTFLS